MKIKKCYYFTREKNFGDLLNEVLFNKLSSSWERVAVKEADYLAIGSLLQSFVKKKSIFNRIRNFFVKKEVILFGTGFIREPRYSSELYSRKIIPIGVRGKLTIDRLQSNGVDCSNVVLGDWGLITDKLLGVPKVRKKYDVGIIPHFVDKSSSFLEKSKNDKNIKVIDIQQSPESFIKELLECRSILSSAMHGLIVSDCYGIPNLALRLSDKIVGGDYKFNDYYSVFDMKVTFSYPSDLDGIGDFRAYIEKKYMVDRKKVERVKGKIWEVFQSI